MAEMLWADAFECNCLLEVKTPDVKAHSKDLWRDKSLLSWLNGKKRVSEIQNGQK